MGKTPRSGVFCYSSRLGLIRLAFPVPPEMSVEKAEQGVEDGVCSPASHGPPQLRVLTCNNEVSIPFMKGCEIRARSCEIVKHSRTRDVFRPGLPELSWPNVL